METQQPLTPAIEHVGNINSPEAIALIAGQKPDVVIVNGTRILKPGPAGPHQGHLHQHPSGHHAHVPWRPWRLLGAIYNNDPANCGVTSPSH
jgi:hypothetical protein